MLVSQGSYSTEEYWVILSVFGYVSHKKKEHKIKIGDKL